MPASPGYCVEEPSVTTTTRTSSPRSTWTAIVPPMPSTSSSGCAASTRTRLIGRLQSVDECGGVSGTGRFPTFSRRRGYAGETWFPPRPQAEGERCSSEARPHHELSPVGLDLLEQETAFAARDDRPVGAHIDD